MTVASYAVWSPKWYTMRAFISKECSGVQRRADTAQSRLGYHELYCGFDIRVGLFFWGKAIFLCPCQIVID